MRFLTVGQAAEELSISKSMMHKICNTKQIEYFRIGNRKRFTEEALKDYLERQKVKAEDDR